MAVLVQDARTDRLGRAVGGLGSTVSCDDAQRRAGVPGPWRKSRVSSARRPNCPIPRMGWLAAPRDLVTYVTRSCRKSFSCRWVSGTPGAPNPSEIAAGVRPP
jgi:hypothetical protein